MKEKTLRITMDCNQKCLFCRPTKKDLNFKQPTTEELKRTIYSSAREGVKFITITGGEPTLRNDLIEIIKYIKSLGLSAKLITNGMMFFYEKYCKLIYESGLDKVVISIHSSKPEIHDFLTQVEKSFEKTLAGLKNISIYDIEIETNMVINNNNKDNLKDYVDMIKKIDRNISMTFSLVEPSGRALNNTQLIPKYSDIREKIIEVSEYCLKNKVKFRYTSCFMPFCFIDIRFLSHSDWFFYLKKQHNREFVKVRSSNSEKIQACKDCFFSDFCCGPPKNYVSLYGEEEFRPFKEKIVLGEIISADYNKND